MAVRRVIGIVLTSLLWLTSLTGCGVDHQMHQLQDAQKAFDQQDYDKTYRLAKGVASSQDRGVATQGQYLAGVSARRLGNNTEAQQYLAKATSSTDASLSGDAWAELGFLYNHENRFREASDAFANAANRLTGQDRANAHFQSGIAQQKLGFWPAARSSLLLARGYNRDAAIGKQIDEYLQTVGFTLQVGAYRSQANAQSRVAQVANQTQYLRVGLPQITRTYSSEGGTYYRVHVGRFTDFASAAHAQKQMGYTDALIVPLSRNQ
jgi:tetratricopeptide (TPR) repeat protein